MAPPRFPPSSSAARLPPRSTPPEPRSSPPAAAAGAAALAPGSLEEVLLQAAFDGNLRLVRSETALTFAINSGNADMVRYLLDHGADTEKLNNDGLTVLHFASGEEVAARCGARKDVETLFPVTSRIPCVHDWTVDGIINYAKSLPDVKDEEFCEAMLDMGKFQGREAVKKKIIVVPCTFIPRSLCWLKLGEGEKALIDAEACRMMQPNWPEACYRQGAALMLLKDYKNACRSFLDGLKLEPENVEMNNALRLCLVQRKVWILVEIRDDVTEKLCV
uniref:Uncharacterized protein n=1 Tax=Oryza glumipatula TaxID=40148 RepID=A0A0D9YSG7_9ORYZ